MPFSIGTWLRKKRLDANLGLRQFSEMIGDSAPNVCNIENGKRQPWQNEQRLRRVAQALGFEENSEDWDTLFNRVCRADQAPADLTSIMNRPYMPTLLRTIGERQLTDDEILRVVNYVKRLGKGR